MRRGEDRIVRLRPRIHVFIKAPQEKNFLETVAEHPGMSNGTIMTPCETARSTIFPEERCGAGDSNEAQVDRLFKLPN